MTLLHAYLNAHAQGMALVQAATGMDATQLIELGADRATAKNLSKLAEIYFGNTSFTKYQAQCATNSHNLSALITIERYVARVKKVRDQWKLREKLCRTPEKHIARVAKQHLPAATPKEGIKIMRRDNGAPMTVSLTGASTILADFVSALDPHNPIASLNNLLDGSVARPQIHANVIVPLDAHTRIVQGDNDVILHTSHGATMTGAEFVARHLAQEGFATLVSPMQGAVNLYRTSRFASSKQRIMLQAETSTCAWPGCRKPIDHCQTHHIIGWKYGGETNIDNLVPLCTYHNGINDDRAAAQNTPFTTRGWIAKRTWHPPN
ncbi:HNH endonuclease signature motif containing protein [Corynebacterium sp. sy039]|uniref:HNH endonuclease signature motif containing protein n=1 Tax=Corynebacterium sp. sy039 TaxID=2599641 RepID=UPI0011B5CB82|nr:HNH endonuclease signature motif containing protein [Corynebacterium sp. sy039]QDZ43339.1 HNH endonuclease [Corynebacterium sp. sy039]